MRQDYTRWGPVAAGHRWPHVYQSLTRNLPGTRTKAAQEALAHCHTAGPRAVVQEGAFAFDEDPYSEKGDEEERAADPTTASTGEDNTPAPQAEATRIASRWWMQQLAEDGTMPRFRMPDTFSGSSDIGSGLETCRSTTGLDTYEALLRRWVNAEPLDVSFYVRLGDLALERHDGETGGHISYAPPSAADRRRYLGEALSWYEAAVAVGESSLSHAFCGRLPWSESNNRPFLEALHGLALTLWRLGRFNSAERVLVTMLYLNPGDDQGALELLATVRTHRRWHPGVCGYGEPRDGVLIDSRLTTAIIQNSLRTFLAADVPPSRATVDEVVRRATAEALNATWDGHSSHVIVGSARNGIKLTVVARHQNGHSLAPDAHWWDAHSVGQETDGPVLLVLVADPGYIAVAQLLRTDQLAAYHAADLPGRDRMAFTTTFIHNGTHYGTDLASRLDKALDARLAEPGSGRTEIQSGTGSPDGFWVEVSGVTGGPWFTAAVEGSDPRAISLHVSRTARMLSPEKGVAIKTIDTVKAWAVRTGATERPPGEPVFVAKRGEEERRSLP
ncbi:tetratricopeptide repeat protein [Streptomyces europaeiscabiei]|uniref:tetratricopeptide repeat protein n=1 Tax=Streptomyces europaeiscabiei TaxID=146819 RepID=UPI0038F71927